MKKLSTQDEQKVLTALESAIKLVGSGMTPDIAITKAAGDAKLEPPMIQRMVEAYNVSKTLSHLSKAAGADRAQTFPIANAAAILQELFPMQPTTEQEKAAAAIHPDYLAHVRRPDFMKVASLPELPRMVAMPSAAYERDPAARAKRAIDERSKLQLLHKQATEAYREMYYRLMGEVEKAAAYWKRFGDKVPFDLVEKRAYAAYGPMAKSLMDMIERVGGLDDRRVHVKRAAASELGTQEMSFNIDETPNCHVADAILFAKELCQLRKEAAAITATIHEHAIGNVDLMSESQVLAGIDYFMPKEAKKDMPGFLEQDRPKKVKSIYKAIKRDHPGMPAEMKARIASRRGSSSPAKRKEGPPYKTPIARDAAAKPAAKAASVIDF